MPVHLTSFKLALTNACNVVILQCNTLPTLIANGALIFCRRLCAYCVTYRKLDFCICVLTL